MNYWHNLIITMSTKRTKIKLDEPKMTDDSKLKMKPKIVPKMTPVEVETSSDNNNEDTKQGDDGEDEDDEDDEDEVLEINRGDEEEIPTMGGFMPFPPQYMMFHQPPAEPYEMLNQLLTHDGKNIANILEDVRVSLDCVAEALLKINKTLERHPNYRQK
jgi:hypothetical protein